MELLFCKIWMKFVDVHDNIVKIKGGMYMKKERKGLGRKILLGFGWTVLLVSIGFFAYAIYVNHLM